LLQALLQLPDITDANPSLLPTLGARKSCEIWPQLDAEFAATPTWQSLPTETGAFARWGGQNPTAASAFAARWQARCAEVWSWAADEVKVGAGGTASAASVGLGRGRALVETARGVLMHEITLDGDTIRDYVVVAPTEWNFHPEGILTEWLQGTTFTDETALRNFVAQAVGTLDPCVPWELELHT
jgi:coenzyme F420-reducing hydrogenase alpha subunit